MPIATCPSCSHAAKLNDSAAGKTLRCPRCGTRFKAPTVSAPIAPAAAEADWRTEAPTPTQALRTKEQKESQAARQEPDRDAFAGLGSQTSEEVAVERFRKSQAPAGTKLAYASLAIIALVALVCGAVAWDRNRRNNAVAEASATPSTPANPVAKESPPSPITKELPPPNQKAKAETSVEDAERPDAKKREQEKEDALARERAAARQEQQRRLARATPQKVSFKDFANFPEDYSGCVRFNSVWLHGDFERVDKTRMMSPAVSSRDGKLIWGVRSLDSSRKAFFLFSAEMGRRLSLRFEDDIKYGVNLCCELTKSDNRVTVLIYRVETLDLNGDVKDVYEGE